MKVIFRTKNIIVKNTVILWSEEECCDIKIYARAPHGNSEISEVHGSDGGKVSYVMFVFCLVRGSVCYYSYLINYTCWDLFPGD